MELAETIVIKSEYSALLLNDYCTRQYGEGSFDSNYPETWKYYLNISGEYFSEDTVMTISSLDTMQEITFSKANLNLHPATKSAYQYGTRYYRELVLRYPENEQLILGILYPCDIQTAIEADDFTVLSYPPHLVEENEASLIENINIWLAKYNHLWNNKQFTFTDVYYGHACVGVMYLQLPPLIINLRLKACRTNEVHSYHIREYLASHGMLDEYLSRMTNKQALFFYRNINYIERNNGKVEIFEWLMEKIMTDRGLPLSEYTMRHDISTHSTDLEPTVMFRRRLLNTEVATFQDVDNYATLDTILTKEIELAKGNEEYIFYNKADIRRSFQRTLSATIATKVLESAVTDLTDAVPYTLHHALLNHWMYYSQKNLYTAYLLVKDPRTGIDFTIGARDAYMYFLYAFAKSIGITLTKIPPLYCERVQRDPIPDTTDLMKVVDSKYISVEEADFVKSFNPVIGTMTTAGTFISTVEAIHDASMKQSNYVANKEHMYTRGLAHALISRIYKDELVQTVDQGMAYEEWMDNAGLGYADFTEKDWYDLSLNLYEQATGRPMNVTEGVNGLQKAMVGLFEKLSSYSIQFITDINKTAVKVVNWAAVRVGDMKGAGKAFYEIQLYFMKLLRHAYRIHAKYAVEIPADSVKLIGFMGEQNVGSLEIPFETQLMNNPNARAIVNIGSTGLLSYEGFAETIIDIGTTKHFEAYYALTDAEKLSYKNVFDNCMQEPFYPTQVDMNDLILTNNINGFVYQQTSYRALNAFQYYYVPRVTYYFSNINEEATLDGFYINYGDTDAGAIIYNGGSITVPGIKYLTGSAVDVTTLSMDYSGSWAYSTLFEPTLATDEQVELTFNLIVDTAEVAFSDVHYSGGLAGFINTAGSVPMDIADIRDSTTLNLVALDEEATLDGFQPTTFKFDYQFVNALVSDTIDTDFNAVLDIGTLPDSFTNTAGTVVYTLENTASVYTLNTFENTTEVFNLTVNNLVAVSTLPDFVNTSDVATIVVT